MWERDDYKYEREQFAQELQLMDAPKDKVCVRVVSSTFGGSIVSPVCENAHRFCQLTGTEFLSDIHLYIIGKLGFDIVYK